ncbi:MAG: outer membrane protein transport protein [Pseudomonadota bacterium]
MTRFTLAVVAIIAGTATAHAGALDRSSQDIDIIFEEGNYLELNAGYVAPDISGSDFLGTGTSSGDVGDNYFQGSIAYKHQVTDRLSLALIIDQPYGADIEYPLAVNGGSILLGGTQAFLDSVAYTGLARWKFNERVSAHAGFRIQQLNAAVALNGLGYGPLNGYSGVYDGDTAPGFQVGVAYEIPEIAFRIAATYFSEIEHKLTADETLPGAPPGFSLVDGNDFEIDTPQAVNISFQTGIAEGTLLFASFRFADYSALSVRPPEFEGITPPSTSLVSIDPVRDYTLGIGRQFTDRIAGSVTLNFSDTGPDDNVSPLAPIDGRYGITLGGSYQVTQALKVSGGVNYTRFISANPTVAGVSLADFDDNDAVAAGISIGYRF